MGLFLRYLILLVIPFIFVSDFVYANDANIFTPPDKSFSIKIPSSWKRIPQENIDKIQEKAGDSSKGVTILAGFGEVNGEVFNPYVQIFNSKKLTGVVNEQTLNTKANEIQKSIQSEMDKNKSLQNKMGMSNSVVESANVDAKNGIVSIYMVSDISNGAILESKLYMVFGKEEYVLLGFYNVTSSMETRKLNGNNDLTKLTETTVNSFEFNDSRKYNPNEVNTDIFSNVLERGFIGVIIGGLFVLITGLFSVSTKKKRENKLISVDLPGGSSLREICKSRNRTKIIFSSVLVVLLFIFSYFAFNFVKNNFSKEATQLNDVPSSAITTSSFDKKVACEKVISPIKEELEQIEQDRLASPSALSLLSSERFNFGFYSPVTDSCLYVTFRMTDLEKREDTINIYDALTKRLLYKFQNDGVGGSSFSEYVAKISELSDGEIQIH